MDIPKLTGEIQFVTRLINGLERDLKRQDYGKAKRKAKRLHSALEKMVSDHGPELGLEPQSVIPKDPQ